MVSSFCRNREQTSGQVTLAPAQALVRSVVFEVELSLLMVASGPERCDKVRHSFLDFPRAR